MHGRTYFILCIPIFALACFLKTICQKDIPIVLVYSCTLRTMWSLYALILNSSYKYFDIIDLLYFTYLFILKSALLRHLGVLI